jgi:hypothetical protein
MKDLFLPCNICCSSPAFGLAQNGKVERSMGWHEEDRERKAASAYAHQKGIKKKLSHV